jgi:hypothetical protein
MLDLGKEYHAAHGFWLDNMLQPIGEKFDSTGDVNGKRVKQMLARFQFITKSNSDGVEAGARKWTKALQDTTTAAGYTYYKQFFQEVYDHVIYAIESEPGLDEAAVLREAARTARRHIPPGFTVAEDFNEKLSTLLRETKAMSEKMLKVAEESGLYMRPQRRGAGQHHQRPAFRDAGEGAAVRHAHRSGQGEGRTGGREWLQLQGVETRGHGHRTRRWLEPRAWQLFCRWQRGRGRW